MLKHNVTKSHDEPDDEKMSSFLQLKYHRKQDAKAKLGVVKTRRNTIIDDQRYLYHRFLLSAYAMNESLFLHMQREFMRNQWKENGVNMTLVTGRVMLSITFLI